MKGGRLLTGLAAAALLCAATAPETAAAKRVVKGADGKQYVVKDAKPRAAKNCKGPAPPWMYNPRNMNRGLLKASRCRGNR